MQIKTVILLENFSFGLINFVNLSTTFVFDVFYFFHKKRIFNIFYSWVNVFYIYGSSCAPPNSFDSTPVHLAKSHTYPNALLLLSGGTATSLENSKQFRPFPIIHYKKFSPYSSSFFFPPFLIV